MTQSPAKPATIVVLGCLCAFHRTSAIAQSPTRLAEDREDTVDVLFLAVDAPLWLRLKLEGDQNSVRIVRSRYAQLLIETVDADGDGYAGPAEAEKLPADGRLSGKSHPLGSDWKRLDNIEADDRLSADEYLAGINDFIGPSFTVRRKPPQLAQSVQLLPRLDQDGDHGVSTVEIGQGLETLQAFDFDNDGTFSPAELQPFPQTMVDAALAEQLGDDAQPFILLDETASQSEFVERLQRKYASSKGIPRERSGVSAFAFAQLDTNGNGSLDSDEAVGLLQPRPAVEIGVDLFAGRVTLKRKGRNEDGVAVLSSHEDRRLALRLQAEAVEFSAHDNRFAASDQINLLRVRFLQGDGDRNGYMDPQEFVSLAGLEAGFDEVDRDGDGKVFLDELDRFIRIDSYLAQCSIEMEIESVEKPLFRLLDANLDRRLTAREFATATSRLEEFDENGDGTLNAMELDLLRRFRVKFAFVVPPAVRPERNMSMMASRRLPVSNRVQRSGPDWFLDMDRNQDGDLTWREFLGPRNLFDELDTDSSGWIDAQEAAATPATQQSVSP